MEDIRELRIGNWVRDVSGFSMYVQSLYDEDTVYLDFPENGGDTWEENISEVEPIEIEESLLKQLGFRQIPDWEYFLEGFVEGALIYYDLSDHTLTILTKRATLHHLDIKHLHQLQNCLFDFAHKEIADHDIFT